MLGDVLEMFGHAERGKRKPRNFLMTKRRQLATATFLTLAMLACLSAPAHAAQCGSGAAGFDAWKQQFAGEARAKGIGASAISALMATNYAQATINADRGQRSFSLSLDAFLAKRGASAIVARGRSLKHSQGAMFASIQARYGVPPGPLIAIWGMETGFGSQRGNQNMLSSIATLAYDCRRPAYFTEQLYAALQLIDRGALSPSQRGICRAPSRSWAARSTAASEELRHEVLSSRPSAQLRTGAGTHNHRRQLLKRSRQPFRLDNIGRGVWVPAQDRDDKVYICRAPLFMA